MKLRKASKLASLQKSRRTVLDRERLHECEFAAEIALGILLDRQSVSLDMILCNPELAAEFDAIASRLEPADDVKRSLYFRWAALGLRKRAKSARLAAKELGPRLKGRKGSQSLPFISIPVDKFPEAPGLYFLCIHQKNKTLYVGETANLRGWVEKRQESGAFSQLKDLAKSEGIIRHCSLDSAELHVRHGAQSYFAQKRRSIWNFPQLRQAEPVGV